MKYIVIKRMRCDQNDAHWKLGTVAYDDADINAAFKELEVQNRVYTVRDKCICRFEIEEA